MRRCAPKLRADFCTTRRNMMLRTSQMMVMSTTSRDASSAYIPSSPPTRMAVETRQAGGDDGLKPEYHQDNSAVVGTPRAQPMNAESSYHGIRFPKSAERATDVACTEHLGRGGQLVAHAIRGACCCLELGNLYKLPCYQPADAIPSPSLRRSLGGSWSTRSVLLTAG